MNTTKQNSLFTFLTSSESSSAPLEWVKERGTSLSHLFNCLFFLVFFTLEDDPHRCPIGNRTDEFVADDQCRGQSKCCPGGCRRLCVIPLLTCKFFCFPAAGQNDLVFFLPSLRANQSGDGKTGQDTAGQQRHRSAQLRPITSRSSAIRSLEIVSASTSQDSSWPAPAPTPSVWSIAPVSVKRSI